MKSNRPVYTVEPHIIGGPLRLIVGGFPNLPGKSMPGERTVGYHKNGSPSRTCDPPCKSGNGRAKSVSFENAPSFVYQEGILSEAKGFGNLKPDIVFRGSFFAMLSSRQIGIDICRENASKLIDAGTSVLEAVNKQIQVRRPVLSHINTADLCEIYGPAKSKGADMQNITAPDGQIDRSPCGTEYTVLKIHPDR